MKTVWNWIVCSGIELFKFQNNRRKKLKGRRKRRRLLRFVDLEEEMKNFFFCLSRKSHSERKWEKERKSEWREKIWTHPFQFQSEKFCKSIIFFLLSLFLSFVNFFLPYFSPVIFTRKFWRKFWKGVNFEKGKCLLTTVHFYHHLHPFFFSISLLSSIFFLPVSFFSVSFFFLIFISLFSLFFLSSSFFFLPFFLLLFSFFFLSISYFSLKASKDHSCPRFFMSSNDPDPTFVPKTSVSKHQSKPFQFTTCLIVFRTRFSSVSDFFFFFLLQFQVLGIIFFNSKNSENEKF